jgi:RNA polymerase I-specific transcription initiation factor RRN3
MPLSSSPVPSILKKSKTASHNAAVPAIAGKKRTMIEMDFSSQPSSSSPPSDAGSRDGPPPPKRARVQFDATAEKGQHMRDEKPREKSVALVREEVRRAIQRHVSGTDSEGYDQVKEIFTIDPKKLYDEDSPEVPSPTAIKRHLTGLLSNISALDRNCSGLVNAVLSSEWLGRDESYVKLFVRFLGNLCAAHTGYLRSVLKMLVNYFGEGKKRAIFFLNRSSFTDLII